MTTPLADRFGKWTVIEADHWIVYSAGRHSASLVRCDCGVESVVRNSVLVRGKSTSCRRCSPRRPVLQIEPGEKFGKWTVIEADHWIVYPSCRHSASLVRCDCGVESVVLNNKLLSNKTTQCQTCANKIKNSILKVVNTRYDPLSKKIASALRSRLSSALKGNCKAGSAVRDLGCSIAEFKGYIERLFKPGMTWENWGLGTWHLDHICPLAGFDLTDPVQFALASHFTNYQPLWAQENLTKGSHFDVKC